MIALDVGGFLGWVEDALWTGTPAQRSCRASGNADFWELYRRLLGGCERRKQGKVGAPDRTFRVGALDPGICLAAVHLSL